MSVDCGKCEVQVRKDRRSVAVDTRFAARITAVLVNAELAKELPTIIPGPLIQDPQPYTLVTPYGHKLLEDFHRLGMN
jgi:hypothetical protein